MLRSRAFLKKRGGKVVKKVVEHYLRDDVACGVPACPKCAAAHAADDDDDDAAATGPAPALGDSPRALPACGGPHYVVPDTNVFVNQIDVIEHKGLEDVIILQTVLEELRHNSPAIHSRLRNVIADSTRRFFVFSNEHRRETYVERDKDESPNDRNDRAIRTAVLWYQNHLNDVKSNAGVVLMTDDLANKVKAKEIGLRAFTVREYIEQLTEEPQLLDILAKPSESEIAEDSKIQYDEHLTASQIAAGVKSAKLLQGKLMISTYNVLEGSIFARVDGEERSVSIIGRKALSRAVDEDIVAVRLLPREEWGNGGSVLVEEEEDDQGEVTKDEDSQDKSNVPDKAVGPICPQGVIVGIIRRNWRPYCGFIRADSVRKRTSDVNSAGAMQPVLFRPIDRRIPTVRIFTRQAVSLVRQRIVVSIDSWPRTSRYPVGHFVKALGDAMDRDTEVEVILLEHGVPHADFSANVLKDLPPEGDKWVVKDEVHLKGREDLRHLNTCSIDPPGCTDIDDALHLRPLPNGNFEAGVHIADVTHFVKPNTSIDKEAASRGTTVYLVNRRIDMLPGLLGTNLCSLRSNVDRLAFSCIWELTGEGEILNVRFTKSIICSKASFTYDEAQARIDDPSMNDELTQSIRHLNNIAKKLNQSRVARGALVLASPEVRFKMDDESQDPLDLELKELKETNKLVEEFMLLANISVAERIFSSFPDTSLLRRHPTPPETNFDLMKNSLGALGIELHVKSSKALADSLDLAVHPDDPYINKLVRIMTTRCMMQALYFSSGTLAAHEYRHYGLASDIYTHFTSPIRRYADVVVHRLLEACVVPEAVYGSELTDKAQMSALCDVLNRRHRMAQQAARDSVELYTHLFFKDKAVLEEAYVTRTFKNGFSVLVPRYGIEAAVYLPEGCNLIFDPKTGILSSGDSSAIKLFQKLVVKVSLDEELWGGGLGGARHKLLVQLVRPSIPGLSVDAGNLVIGKGLGTSEIDGIRLEDEGKDRIKDGVVVAAGIDSGLRKPGCAPGKRENIGASGNASRKKAKKAATKNR